MRRNELLSHTAAELRERCKALDLKGYGNKQQLADRILAAEPAPSKETLAAEAEAIRAAKSVKPTPTCDWLPLGEMLIPEMTVQIPGYLDGAVLERYEQLCDHAKRQYLKLPQTLSASSDEVLEFGTRRKGESATTTSEEKENVVPASEAALEWDESEGGEDGEWEEEVVEDDEDDHDHDDHDHEDETLCVEVRLSELAPSNKFPSHVNNVGAEEVDRAVRSGINSGLNSRETGELIRQACRRL